LNTNELDKLGIFKVWGLWCDLSGVTKGDYLLVGEDYNPDFDKY
jgi:hypothetical protein